MPYGEAVADLDFGAIFRAGAEQRSDDTVLVGISAKGVVQDGENSLSHSQKTKETERPAIIRHTWGWMTTFRGAVVGADPTVTGPRGRAR